MVDSTIMNELEDMVENMSIMEKKEKEKADDKRAYMRLYQQRRREDPEYAEKIRKACRENKKKRFDANAELGDKNKLYQREYYARFKDVYKQARDSINAIESQKITSV